MGAPRVKLQSSYCTQGNYSLAHIENTYLQDVIHYIEDTPPENTTEAFRYERSKGLWKNRNHFLSSYLEVLKLRVRGRNGAAIPEEERNTLIFQAMSYMKASNSFAH